MTIGGNHVMEINGKRSIQMGGWIAVMLGLRALTSTGYAAQLTSGSGTLEDPYAIATVEQLLAVDDEPDACYVLTTDIDFSGRSLSSAPIYVFSGRFDGQGHRITNLKITGSYWLGLFSYIRDSAEVCNLGLVDAYVASTGWGAGLLAGKCSGAIINCYCIGSVTGDWYVGGIAGNNQGHISQCHSTGSVTGGWNIGGLVGENSGNIFQSYSTASVTGEWYTGGLIGDNYGYISQNYCTGSVTGNEYIGGLAGANLGHIVHNFCTGSVTGARAVGGLVGGNAAHILQSYSVGRVTGAGKVGGLVGTIWGGEVVQCVWDRETSGQTVSTGGEGLPTSKMREVVTYCDRRWDFAGESANGLSEVWQIPKGGEYPVLSVFNGYIPVALGGEGTLKSPYQISTAADLAAISFYGSGKVYALMNDIDFLGSTWSVAPIVFFNGFFDGKERVLRNLQIDGDHYLGLFGQLGRKARVHDFRIADATVIGAGHRIGLLAGRNDGIIRDSHSTGSTTGTWTVGGLAGINTGLILNCHSNGLATGKEIVGGFVGGNTGHITKSYNNGAITGDHYVGGFVGWNVGRISQSFNSGSVAGDWRIGGLVGYNTGLITQSYNAGSVTGDNDVGGLVGECEEGTVLGCYSAAIVTGNSWLGGLLGASYGGVVHSSFWDTALSHQTSSSGGMGKPTESLLDPATFIGWGNGIWTLLAGQDYPRLAWEAIPGEMIVDTPRPYKGSGDESDPYRIRTGEDLQAIGWHPSDWDKIFIMMTNIELDGTDQNAWQVIGIPRFPFTGLFDGQGFMISSFKVHLPNDNYIGLFGLIGQSETISGTKPGTVQNLVFGDANVTGNDVTGILAGKNEGIITNCHTTGHVQGRLIVGGLVGWDRGQVHDSSAKVEATGWKYLDPMIGYTDDGFPDERR